MDYWWYDYLDEFQERHGETFYIPGLPRQCPHCGVWARYERNGGGNLRGKRGTKYLAECPFCFKNFVITKGEKIKS